MTDVLGIFVNNGFKVGSYPVKDPDETLGVNDRNQLSIAAKIIQKRINKAHMLAGVSIEDPDNTYIAPTVKIGQDTTIAPGSYIMGNTIIGEESSIGPSVIIKDAKIGSHAKVVMSNVVGAEVKDGEEIGPFANVK